MVYFMFLLSLSLLSLCARARHCVALCACARPRVRLGRELSDGRRPTADVADVSTPRPPPAATPAETPKTKVTAMTGPCVILLFTVVKAPC